MDLQWLPQGLCVEGLVPSLWCYWEVGALQEEEPSRRILGDWVVLLTVLGPQLLSLALFPNHHEVRSFLYHVLPPWYAASP